MVSFATAARGYVHDRLKRMGAYRGELRRMARGSDLRPEIVTLKPGDCIDRAGLALPDRLPGLLWRWANSSGTSGTPLVFPQPLSAVQREQGVLDWVWGLHGFKPHQRIAVLRGSGARDRNGVVRRFGNRLVLSPQGWDEAQVRARVDALNAFRPEVIACYPSVLEDFLGRAAALGLSLPPVPLVLTGSEACLDRHEHRFAEDLGAKTVSWYGLSEQVVFGLKTGEGQFDLLPEYSAIGFLPSEGRYEVCGKSFFNPFFATHWYRTGDFCTDIEVAASEALGRPVLRVRGLFGRAPDYVTLADGTRQPANNLLYGHHGPEWFAVQRFCFVQEAPGRLRFVYAPAPGRDVAPLIAVLEAFVPVDVALGTESRPDLLQMNRPKWTYFYAEEAAFRAALARVG